MEAFQAGCDDYIDRQRRPLSSQRTSKTSSSAKAEGFQPTQMLAQSDTSLSGSLTHHDLPGVMQMLGHAHQTGALHINSGETDALLFFDAGTITHAECGSLFGDEAVIHILKSCFQNSSGVYKFVTLGLDEAHGSCALQPTSCWTPCAKSTNLPATWRRAGSRQLCAHSSDDRSAVTPTPDHSAVTHTKESL